MATTQICGRIYIFCIQSTKPAPRVNTTGEPLAVHVVMFLWVYGRFVEFDPFTRDRVMLPIPAKMLALADEVIE